MQRHFRSRDIDLGNTFTSNTLLLSLLPVENIYFLKKLLHVIEAWFHPHLRIIWLYRRWHSLYSIINASGIPSVEFRQGIPFDLEEDQFLNPNVRNLTVLDDLMSTASKGSRIATRKYIQSDEILTLWHLMVRIIIFIRWETNKQTKTHYVSIMNQLISTMWPSLHVRVLSVDPSFLNTYQFVRVNTINFVVNTNEHWTTKHLNIFTSKFFRIQIFMHFYFIVSKLY